jgi:hypothetical protein
MVGPIFFRSRALCLTKTTNAQITWHGLLLCECLTASSQVHSLANHATVWTYFTAICTRKSEHKPGTAFVHFLFTADYFY